MTDDGWRMIARTYTTTKSRGEILISSLDRGGPQQYFLMELAELVVLMLKE